jgi:hypothetical protein
LHFLLGSNHLHHYTPTHAPYCRMIQWLIEEQNHLQFALQQCCTGPMTRSCNPMNHSERILHSYSWKMNEKMS